METCPICLQPLPAEEEEAFGHPGGTIYLPCATCPDYYDPETDKGI